MNSQPMITVKWSEDRSFLKAELPNGQEIIEQRPADLACRLYALGIRPKNIRYPGRHSEALSLGQKTKLLGTLRTLEMEDNRPLDDVYAQTGADEPIVSPSSTGGNPLSLKIAFSDKHSRSAAGDAESTPRS